MEPLTTIELRACKWLGILALASSAAAELYALARSPDALFELFINRDRTHRSASRQTSIGGRRR